MSAINLSPEAIAMIEDFNRDSVPHAYGRESHALCDFRDWVVWQYDKPQLVCLRNDRRYTTADRDKAIAHYQNYFRNEPRTYSMDFQDYVFINTRSRLTHVRIRYKCEKYFHEHIGSLAERACIAKYGSVKDALLNTPTWIYLWNDFEDWFKEKRENFMVKMDAQIAEIMNKNQVKVGKNKKPAPVGAVANLCKVLTKTMEQQGADISSIAKVQYALCVQNGLYVPDEFLTDVAVALDAEGKL